MSTVTVAAIGDCRTLGDSGPEFAGSLLQGFANHYAAGDSLDLQNLGVTMSTSREGMAVARQQLTRPDIVLLNFGLVDSWITSIPQFYVPYFPDSPWRSLQRRVLKSVKRRLRPLAQRRWVARGPVVTELEFEHNLREIIRIAREKNPDVIVALWGTPAVADDAERNARIHFRYNRIMGLVADQTGCVYYDPSAELSDYTGTVYTDEVHLSAGVQALIGQGLALSVLRVRPTLRSAI